MAEEAKKVPVEESKDTKTVEAKTDEGKKKEATAGEVLDGKKKEGEKEVKMVPEAVLIEYKKESKATQKELVRLQKLIEDGASKEVIDTDLKALAEEYGVDPEFARKFAAAVRKEADADADEKVKKATKPLEEKERAEKREKVFEEHYEKALAEMPEYKKIVNKAVIKKLAFDPENADKTFPEIIESAFGHLVPGKKTLEPTKPRGGKENPTVDVAKAQTDPDYFKEIMADPELKKEYNKGMAVRNKF